jgi:hypothetical protein
MVAAVPEPESLTSVEPSTLCDRRNDHVIRSVKPRWKTISFRYGVGSMSGKPP